MPTARRFLILILLVVAAPLVASTYFVNDLGDTPDAVPGNDLCATAGNVCTLRAAIEEANAHAGSDSIRFSVAGTITPLPLLVSDAVDLDATTSPGYTSAPTLVLSGLTASIQFGPGSSNSVIAGFKIEGGATFGALTIASSNVTVSRNHLGPIGGGTANLHGIRLESTSASCMIGGHAGDGNVISGNATGVIVAGNGHTIAGNRIGTEASGSSAIPNGTGILIGTAAGTTIGTAAARNIISGNDLHGVSLQAGASNTIFVNNFIGLDTNGTAAVPNAADGIHDESAYSIIGTAASGNVISGNGNDGIEIRNPSSRTLIRNNIIGLDAAGSNDLGNNGAGVRLFVDTGFAGAATIGGTGANEGNTISGNTLEGVVIARCAHCQIYGNTIGLTDDRTAARANQSGIHLSGVTTNTIIGETPDGMNVISGNTADGILAESAINLRISYSHIGTNGAGTVDVGNGQSGIHTIGGSNHQIFLNLISGNEHWGVLLDTAGTELSGNIIGRNATNSGALPNVLGGVHLADSNINVVGNVIASNAGSGISVASSEKANYLLSNSIFENAALGIDLLNDAGPTLNDALDADAGGNGLQNFPVITDVIAASTASTIAGSLHSTPLAWFTLHFYSSNTADPSGFGEGRTHIGTENVFTERNGTVDFNWIGPALTPGHVVTATASGPDGTSEFSQAHAVAAGPAIFFSPVRYVVQESEGSVTLTVRREGDLTGASTVYFFASSGSANHATDFVLFGAKLTFGSGVAEQKITIPIVVDAIEEPRETFTVILLNATAAAITANVATIVIDPRADLAVAKAVRKNGAPDLTFLLTVRNLGPDAATNVTVSDVLPAGTTLIAATPSTGSCNGTTTIVCTFGTLAANTGASVQIVTSWNGETVTNTAAANASEIDPNPGNNSGFATANAPPVAAIPTASWWSLLALMSMLTSIAIMRMRT
jgi:uncharacterized repeat protein (TIGR01451 family)/CSLREA domain-containing protein